MTPDEFTQLRRLISTRLSDYLTGVFRTLGSWRDPDAARFVATAVPMVAGSQQTLASLVSVYLASRASDSLGTVVAPVGVPAAEAVDLRPGVTPAQVYSRPFVATWTALSKGADLPTAVDRGADRLAKVVEGDMQMTHSRSARYVIKKYPKQASGWRRVLVGPDNCALCTAAATRTYGVEHLNPLHHNCNCRVEPVFGPSVQAKNSDPPGYVMDHGELGPLLVRPQDAHITPADLPA